MFKTAVSWQSNIDCRIEGRMEKKELKVELHAHTNFDPRDAVEYSAHELIEKASQLGFHALAITCHNALQWSEELRGFASDRGITLIPGVEATVEGFHVLIYGLRRYRSPMNFAQLRALRQAHPEVLTLAPHPFYPGKSCLGNKLLEYCDCFDGVEFSHFYTPSVNFNRRAVQFAGDSGKPIVGTSDCHLLEQIDTTSALVFAPINDYESIAAAIRRGDVQLVTRPLGTFEMIRIFSKMLRISALGKISPARTNAAHPSKGWS
jgi:predicted metal-dependent phosphoesterase TrpH